MDDILASKMSRPGEGISLRSLKLDGRCIIESENTPILENGVLQFEVTNSEPGETHLLRCAYSRSAEDAELRGRFARECLPRDRSLQVWPKRILGGANLRACCQDIQATGYQFRTFTGCNGDAIFKRQRMSGKVRIVSAYFSCW